MRDAEGITESCRDRDRVRRKCRGAGNLESGGFKMDSLRIALSTGTEPGR